MVEGSLEPKPSVSRDPVTKLGVAIISNIAMAPLHRAAPQPLTLTLLLGPSDRAFAAGRSWRLRLVPTPAGLLPPVGLFFFLSIVWLFSTDFVAVDLLL